MNLWIGTGRLVKEPEIRYTTGDKPICVANFTIAVDKWSPKNGKGADFIRATAFGKIAENMERFCGKGQMLGVVGKLDTGSYEKDGQKHHTTNVVADKVEFLSRVEKTEEERASQPPKGFSHLEDDISFEDSIPF